MFELIKYLLLAIVVLGNSYLSFGEVIQPKDQGHFVTKVSWEITPSDGLLNAEPDWPDCHEILFEDSENDFVDHLGGGKTSGLSFLLESASAGKRRGDGSLIPSIYYSFKLNLPPPFFKD